MKTLVLGLGNELLADDAVGILVARKLAGEIRGWCDIIESSLHGLALLDILAGYDRAIIIDAIQTGRYPPGTVIEMTPDDFRPTINPSPHFTGLPEMMRIARQLDVVFPRDIRILAVEITDSLNLGSPLTPEVGRAVDILAAKAVSHLEHWKAVRVHH